MPVRLHSPRGMSASPCGLEALQLAEVARVATASRTLGNSPSGGCPYWTHPRHVGRVSSLARGALTARSFGVSTPISQGRRR